MSDVVCCLLAGTGFDRAAQGVLGAGRRLADSLGGKLHAVVVGPANEALNTGAAAVADSVGWPTIRSWPSITPRLTWQALAAACKPLSPQAVLLGNDSYSQELAARLAHRLGGSAAGDAVTVAAAGDTIRVTRGVYGGKATAVIELKRSPGRGLDACPGAWNPADASGRSAAGEVEQASLELAGRRAVESRHAARRSPRRRPPGRRPGDRLGRPRPGRARAVRRTAKRWPKRWARRWPPRGPPATPAGCRPVGKSDRPARRSRPSSTWPSPSPAPASTSWASPTRR